MSTKKMSNNSYRAGNLSLTPFGGVAGVTKNLFIYQYQQDILVIDCGIGFPDEPESEDDLLIPDFSYLLKNKDRIKGLVITHAHFDHYGAVPNLLKRLKVPLYSSALTWEFIKLKLKEANINPRQVDFHQLDQKSSRVKIGCFKLTPFHINHSVPQSLGLFIDTPAGNIFHVSDYKFDWTPLDEEPFDIQRASRLAAKEQPLVLLSDCLGAANPGHTESEATIRQVLENIMSQAKKKVLVTTVSSNILRIKQTIQAAASVGRKVTFLGRSLEQSSKIALDLGYLKPLKQHLASPKKLRKLPPAKQCLVIAGSYGQENSSLTRASQNKHHLVKIKKGDMVIFSADPAPPQVIVDVNQVIDNLTRLGARVYYYEIQDNLHVSGHGTAEDVKTLFAFIKPKYLIPIGGDYRHMYAYSLLAQQMGWKEKEILLLEEQERVEFTADRRFILK